MADPQDIINQLAQITSSFQQNLQRLGSSFTATTGGINQSANQLRNTFGAVGSGLAGVGVGMNRLRSDIDRGRIGYREAAQSLRHLQQEFDDLDASVRGSNAGQAILAHQQLMSAQLLRKGMAEVVTDLGKTVLGGVFTYYKNQITTSIKNVQDNAGGLQSAFNLQNVALRDQISTLDNLSKVAIGAATDLSLLAPPVAAAAGGLGLLLGAISKSQEGVASAVGILQVEIAKSSEAFKIVTSAGATFADDIIGMRKNSVEAGLDFKEFAQIISQNSDTLANFGGTVGAGVKKFVETNIQMSQFRRGLLNLGYTVEEQAQATIDYTDLMRSTGQLEKMQAGDLAKGTSDYLTNLRAVSAFTGEDAKKAQARAREASQQLAVQSKLMAKGPEAMAAFESTIRNMDPIMQKAMQQGVAFDGTIVDESLSQLFAMSPSRKALFDRTYADFAAGLDPEQITANYQRNLKELGASMAKEAASMGSSVGTLNLATGGLAELTKLLENTVTLGLKGVEAAKDATSTADAMKALRDKTEGLVPEISRATEAFIKARTDLTLGLDSQDYLTRFAQGKLPTNAAAARKSLAEQILEASDATNVLLRNIDIYLGKQKQANTQTSNEEKKEKSERPFGGMPDSRQSLEINPRLKEDLERKREENRDWIKGFFGQSKETAMHVIVDNQPTTVSSVSPSTVSAPVADSVSYNTDRFSETFPSKFGEAFAMAMVNFTNKNQQSLPEKKVSFDDEQLAAVLTRSFETALSNPNELSRGIDSLKQQMAEASREQLIALKTQQDKTDAVEVALRDNIRVSEDIVRTLA